jgi:hypothetical protein
MRYNKRATENQEVHIREKKNKLHPDIRQIKPCEFPHMHSDETPSNTKNKSGQRFLFTRKEEGFSADPSAVNDGYL